MTICIGALADGGKSIVCVADKALTYGNVIQWDADSTKIIPVGKAGAHIMISGTEMMMMRVLGDFGAKITADNFDPVDACKWLEEAYGRAESAILRKIFLKPGFLTASRYNAAVAQNPSVGIIKDIFDNIKREREQEQIWTACSLLLCGYHNQNPFLLNLTYPGIATNYAHTGFQAVGSGFEQAVSRLLWSGWKREHPLHRVVYDTFDAKATAETVPTVGSDFDIVLIFDGAHVVVDEPTRELIERAWADVNRSPFEQHDPIKDIPLPPADWKEQLEAYCDKARTGKLSN